MLKSRFLAYGSRATTPSTASSYPPRDLAPNALSQLLDGLAAVRVPHSFFTHFYVASVACSIFWGFRLQLWNLNGLNSGREVSIAWMLMLLQGVRRLVESYTYMSTSKSDMWFGHYFLGLLFYLTVNVAVWIEGLQGDSTPSDTDAFKWKAAVWIPAILTAHVLQHTYHAYLFRLRTEQKGYQLPSHPLFPNLLCPHYTCEIAIYLFLSFLAAPPRTYVNWTLITATVFVAVNLGVTAVGTKEWYMHKFGADRVQNRKRILPWLW